MFASAFLLSPLLAAAPFAALEGRLLVEGVPVDDIVDVTVMLTDGGGAPLLEHESTGVEVVGGDFLLTDLDLGALSDAQWSSPITLMVSAAGLSSAPQPFPRAPMAVLARQAEEAALAAQATALGGLAPDLYARRSALAVSSAVGIPFGNVAGVPAGIADGVDQGPLTSNTGTLRVDGGGVLRVQSGAATPAVLAAGAVGGSALGANAVTSGALQSSAVSHAKLAAATLVDADFGADSVGTGPLAGVEVSAYEVTAVGCRLPVGALSNSATCEKDNSGCSSGQRQDCTTGTCGSSGGSTCANVYAGLILATP